MATQKEKRTSIQVHPETVQRLDKRKTSERVPPHDTLVNDALDAQDREEGKEPPKKETKPNPLILLAWKAGLICKKHGEFLDTSSRRVIYKGDKVTIKKTVKFKCGCEKTTEA